MAATPFLGGKFQALNARGVVPGAKLYTYSAGTTTPKATYTAQDGLSPNANPVLCDANGQASVWGSGTYRMILRDASDVTIWDVDNFSIGDLAALLSDTTAPSKGAGLVGYDSDNAYNGSTVGSQFFYRSVMEHGASRTNTNAQNKAALQAAIGAANTAGVTSTIVVPPFICYGYDVDDLTTHPDFSGVTVPVTVVDYGPGASYAGYPTAYDGSQVRYFHHTPQTTAPITFTAGLGSGATSGTLTSNWALSSGPWPVTFSNGDVRQVTLTNGASTATWTSGLSSNATSSAVRTNPGQHNGNTHWVRGRWHPAINLINDSGHAAAFAPTRNAYDNRRASIVWWNDGAVTWRAGQGSLTGHNYSNEELSNWVLELWNGTWVGAPSVADIMCVDRLTGNIGWNTGTNAFAASYQFKQRVSGYYTGLFESLATTATLILRTSNGSGDDVAIKNVAGDVVCNIPAIGDALVIKKATRNVLIGATSDDASAILNVASTTKGFLPPKMTTTQRDAISSPTEGLVIYNTTTHKLNVRTAAAWEAITSV